MNKASYRRKAHNQNKGASSSKSFNKMKKKAKLELSKKMKAAMTVQLGFSGDQASAMFAQLDF